VAEAARDRARSHAQNAALQAADAEAGQEEAAAQAAATKAASSLARRVPWDSSLAEALERRRRQDEVSDRRRARRAECVKRSHFDDGAGPSGVQ
jgi:hypothetical protein